MPAVYFRAFRDSAGRQIIGGANLHFLSEADAPAAVLIVHVPQGRAERGRIFASSIGKKIFKNLKEAVRPKKERGANFAVTDSILKKK
jgi:hypothetical protein